MYVCIYIIYIYMLHCYYKNFGVHSFPKFIRSQTRANKLNQNSLESQTIFIGDFSDSHGSAKDKSEQNALGKLRKRYDMIWRYDKSMVFLQPDLSIVDVPYLW